MAPTAISRPSRPAPTTIRRFGAYGFGPPRYGLASASYSNRRHQDISQYIWDSRRIHRKLWSFAIRHSSPQGIGSSLFVFRQVALRGALCHGFSSFPATGKTFDSFTTPSISLERLAQVSTIGFQCFDSYAYHTHTHVQADLSRHNLQCSAKIQAHLGRPST